MEIYKRNEQKVTFLLDKIVNSVKAAYESVGKEFTKEDQVDLMLHFDRTRLNTWCVADLGKLIPSVEDIQDRVEKYLMKRNHEVAKSYILYRQERNRKRNTIFIKHFV